MASVPAAVSAQALGARSLLTAVDTNEEFRDLIRHVRRGDEVAARRLIELYEPAIRREARLRLTIPDTRRLLDSDDLCQSVLGTFFIRVATGQYELHEPRQLVALLVKMVRHRAANIARRHRVSQKRRPDRLAQPVPANRVGRVIDGVVDGHSSPSQHASYQELLTECRRRLTPQERSIAERRASGRGWSDIAKELGDSAEALRKRLARALDRVVQELHIDDV